tara:strand:- start:2678 stop:3016 length:339 start_codon:yes stop_codon:yes gene_type:complete
MGQRVRLNYTIDIDNYKAEVFRLLSGAIKGLQGIEVEIDPENLLTLNVAKDIDNLRKSLLEVDYRLADVHSLILGYVGYQASQQQEPIERSPLPSMLEEKVEEFKKQNDDSE